MLLHKTLDLSENRLGQNLSEITDHHFWPRAQPITGKMSSGVELVAAVQRERTC